MNDPSYLKKRASITARNGDFSAQPNNVPPIFLSCFFQMKPQIYNSDAQYSNYIHKKWKHFWADFQSDYIKVIILKSQYIKVQLSPRSH